MKTLIKTGIGFSIAFGVSQLISSGILEAVEQTAQATQMFY